MKIAIDVEGTIADIHKIFVETFNSLYKANLTVEDITSWNFKGTKFEKKGLKPEAFLELIGKIWEEKWQEIPPMESCIGNKIEKLAKKYEVDIVTKQTSDKVLNWLKKYSIPYNSLVVIPLEGYKGKLDYDIFIDDSPELAEELKASNKKILLYDRPYNMDVVENRNIKRVYSFDSILKILL